MKILLRRAGASLVALTLVVSVAPVLDGRAPSARERFDTARAREAEVRAAVEKVAPVAATDEIDRVVRPARRVVTDYEGVVRRFPTSGYSDNALMQAAALSQWLYGRFGRAADRVAAEKYYDWLVREYPASPLRRQARTAVRALGSLVPAVDRVVALAPARPTAPGVSATTPAVATLRAIERVVLGSMVRITLALDRETAFAYEVLDGPPRAFVDLFGATAVETLQDATLRFDAEAVRQVRVGRRPGAVRVVLDLDGAIPVSVFTLYNPYRVIIDAERSAVSRARPVMATSDGAPASAPVAAPAAPLPAAPIVPVTIETALPVRLVDEREVDVTPGPAPPPEPALLPMAPEPLVTVPPPAMALAPPLALAAAPTVPAANTDGTFSLARQLGLGISRIVIDPGHGGHDPGTLTSGSSEARLVLDVALRLEKLLLKDGFDVVLTRRTDVFIPLEQRPAIANREGADMFLSIHANASRNATARGVEVYYLSFASNPEAEAVAARENATSAGGMHNLPSIVRAIALNNKLDESRDLARMAQQSLAGRLAKTNTGLVSRGVKKAPFVVLIGAQMPSILAEIGFITNRQEAALIKTPAYRQKVAESLQAAVVQYQRALKRQTAVATR